MTITSFANKLLASVGVPNPWATKALGVDMARWNTTVDYANMKGTIDFIIARLGNGAYEVNTWNSDTLNRPYDQMFDTHCQGAYDVDLPFMAYWNFLPWQLNNGDITLEHIKNTLLTKLKYKVRAAGTGRPSVYALWIDVEVADDHSGRGINVLPDRIVKYTQDVVHLAQDLFPETVVGVYTSGGFVSSFAPDMTDLLVNENIPLWTAQWLTKATPVVYLNKIADIRNYLPLATSKPRYGNLMPGYLWKLWQFYGDHFVFPKTLGAVDINLAQMSVQELRKWLRYVPQGSPVEPPPPVEPPYVFTIDERVDQLETFVEELGYTGPK